MKWPESLHEYNYSIKHPYKLTFYYQLISINNYLIKLGLSRILSHIWRCPGSRTKVKAMSRESIFKRKLFKWKNTLGSFEITVDCWILFFFFIEIGSLNWNLLFVCLASKNHTSSPWHQILILIDNSITNYTFQLYNSISICIC